MDSLALARRVCADPALLVAREAAAARSREDWNNISAAVRNEDRAALSAHLMRSARDAGTVDFAMMHVEVCDDCADFEKIATDGADALARQALAWYGFFASLRQSETVKPVDLLAGWLVSKHTTLLSRMPAALDRLVAAQGRA